MAESFFLRMFDFAANDQENGQTRDALEDPDDGWSDTIGHNGSVVAEEMLEQSQEILTAVVANWGGDM